jgi:basic amino acid/polyamine antiporter, APA family
MSKGAPHAQSGQQELIGFWMSLALVIGNMIGIGIFMMPAVLAPYGLNGLAGWGVTAFGSVALAGVFSRLAGHFFNQDGPYGQIRDTLGGVPSFIAAWCYWIQVWITNATLAVGVVAYLQAAAPELFADIPPSIIAFSLIWIFVSINLFGVKAGGRVQVFTTMLKLLPLTLAIVLGVWILFQRPGAYTQHIPPNPFSGAEIMAAAAFATFAMQGLEAAAVPAGRVRDPARTIPRATIIGTALTAVIYIAISTIAVLLIPQQQLAHAQAPFVDLLNRMLGANVGRWIALFVVVSGLGCLNGWTLVCGELTRAMVHGGVLPSVLGRSNKHGAPSAGLVLTGMLASAMVLMNYNRSLVHGYEFLSVLVTAAIVPLYLLSSIALIIFGRRTKRPLGSDFYVLALIGAAYSIFIFVGVGPEAMGLGLALAAAGLPLYALMRVKRAKMRAAPAPQ